jgi:hypothetical protein
VKKKGNYGQKYPKIITGMKMRSHWKFADFCHNISLTPDTDILRIPQLWQFCRYVMDISTQLKTCQNNLLTEKRHRCYFIGVETTMWA